MNPQKNFTVPINNLYAGGSLYALPDGSLYLTERSYKQPTRPIIIATHTIKDGDELTRLAFRYYNGRVSDSSKYWHAIARYNNLDSPLDLSKYVGRDIFIPDPQQYNLAINS